jgi:parvulin-like peptidyl-prolyl isomerase
LDRVVAVVNDEIILASRLQSEVDRHPLLAEAMAQLPANAPAAVIAEKRRSVEARVLEDVMYQVLLRQEAKRFDIVLEEREFQAGMESFARQNGLSLDELRKQVVASGEFSTWAEFREFSREQMLAQKAMYSLASWSVSESQVREHYRKLVRDESAVVEVAQFVFAPASAAKAERDKAFARAQQVATQLREGAEVAKISAGSQDVQRKVARGQIAPELEDAIFAAKKGSVVGPLTSGQGYVVFKILGRTESPVLPYEQVKDSIREQLEQEAAIKADEDLRRQLRAKAHIDIRL